MLRRLLCIDQFGERGGGQVILGDVVRGALTAGIDVHVALPAGRFASELRHAGAEVHDIDVPSLHGHRKALSDAARLALHLRTLTNEIRRIACGVRPDLLHVNGGRVLLPAALTKVPCPLTFHAHTAYADRATLLATRWALRRSGCRAVIAPSPFTQAWVREELGVRPAAAKMVWNWVDDAFFVGGRGTQPYAGPDPLRVVVLGRITPVKGQDVAVAAIQALPAEVRRHCVLEICGPVDAETDGRLFVRRLEEQRGNEQRIRLRPVHVEAHGVLGSADLCVVPSLCDETFGLVAAEAMAAGVPVIVSDRGALPGVVGDAGVVVPAGSVGELAATLAALLQDDDLRRSLSVAGRRRAEAYFDRRRQVDAVLGVLRGAAQRVS